MMPSKRLRERQAAMRSRHSEVRPWDHVKDLAARDMILSIRRLIDLGCKTNRSAKLWDLTQATSVCYEELSTGVRFCKE